MNTPSARAVTSPPALMVPTVKTLRPSVRSTQLSSSRSAAIGVGRSKRMLSVPVNAPMPRHALTAPSSSSSTIATTPPCTVPGGPTNGAPSAPVPRSRSPSNVKREGWGDRVERTDDRAVGEEAARIEGLELRGTGERHAERGLARDPLDLLGRQQSGSLVHEGHDALEHVDGGIGGAQRRDQRPGRGDGRRRLIGVGDLRSRGPSCAHLAPSWPRGRAGEERDLTRGPTRRRRCGRLRPGIRERGSGYDLASTRV